MKNHNPNNFFLQSGKSPESYAIETNCDIFARKLRNNLADFEVLRYAFVADRDQGLRDVKFQYLCTSVFCVSE